MRDDLDDVLDVVDVVDPIPISMLSSNVSECSSEFWSSCVDSDSYPCDRFSSSSSVPCDRVYD